MLYDISPQEFAHHVRHATGWHNLGIHCGLEKDKHGKLRNPDKLSMLQQKVCNMRLNTDHFYRQNQFTDDVFKTIVKESYSLSEIVRKCKTTPSKGNYDKILERIEDLDIDISHLKQRKIRTIFKSGSKLDAIDDETFKMLVENNRTWQNLAIACGYSKGGSQKIASRIEKLGVNTNHYDERAVIPTDKLFVVDSHFTNGFEIKKRLIRDFDRPYECNACKNAHFTKRDGVLLWNDQEITLQLEHINGVHNDNENLCFLCPSCHSQTSTFTGRNIKKYKAGQA
jgi:hypothetical protein